MSAGLASGRFLPTDLGWTAGMEAWEPLSEFQDLPPPPPLQELGTSPPAFLLLEPLWEKRHEVGILQALFQTIRGILVNPAEVFSKMPTRGDYLSPLLYVITLTVGVGVCTLPYSTLYAAVFRRLVRSFPGVNTLNMSFFEVDSLSLASIAMAITLMPVLATLGSLLRAGFLHLVLYLVGGANKGFESTFRIICYSDATAAIFRLLPFLGILVTFVLDILLLIIGLKKVNQIEGWRAALTVLFLPFCFFVSIGAGILFLAFSLASKLQ
ncbi:YIP1 family protein [Candidatus Xiphinematobacter sp. Idaho Grape]|uniref:YIP1 family protein n=1 Tax=Candidatus Xiphinematobacter sp. Idaho Grape TaxID=1704307 RepID=UPI001F20818C|nr:YIP1 family protein [Candidatus Xiphinematobacter sp. Idaho Grape]